jgi:hypothetical protein
MSERGDALGGRDRVELRDALGGRDHSNSEMHLEAVIEEVWRCTWRRWSCEFGGRGRVSLELHFEAQIERLRDGLGGANQASLEIHSEAVIRRVWRCTRSP